MDSSHMPRLFPAFGQLAGERVWRRTYETHKSVLTDPLSFCMVAACRRMQYTGGDGQRRRSVAYAHVCVGVDDRRRLSLACRDLRPCGCSDGQGGAYLRERCLHGLRSCRAGKRWRKARSERTVSGLHTAPGRHMVGVRGRNKATRQNRDTYRLAGQGGDGDYGRRIQELYEFDRHHNREQRDEYRE